MKPGGCGPPLLQMLHAALLTGSLWCIEKKNRRVLLNLFLNSFIFIP